MSKGKNICPECGINEKGVRAKTCRPCSVKALAAINKKTEENNNLLTKAVRKDSDTANISDTTDVLTPETSKQIIDKAAKTIELVERMHIEATESKSVYGPIIRPGEEVELIGVDLAAIGTEQTVVTEITPDNKIKSVRTTQPARIGATTPDGKFYK